MNFKRISQILLIIMTTYYMNGCSTSNDDAITYFEERYFSIEKLVDLDNDFQEVLENCVSNDPEYEEVSEEEYLKNVQLISNKLDSLIMLANTLNNNVISQDKTDQSLDRAYHNLLKAYQNVSLGDYSKLVSILKQDTQDEALDKEFNQVYRAASEKLNTQLDIFYSASEEYAKENHIEIDWSE